MGMTLKAWGEWLRSNGLCATSDMKKGGGFDVALHRADDTNQVVAVGTGTTLDRAAANAVIDFTDRDLGAQLAPLRKATRAADPD